MIKEIVLASMMSFGVGVGTIQHEPMQKVEPYTIAIDKNSSLETCKKFCKAMYQWQQIEIANRGEITIKVIDNEEHTTDVYKTIYVDDYGKDEQNNSYWCDSYIPNDQEQVFFYELNVGINGDELTNYVAIYENMQNNGHLTSWKVEITNEYIYKFYVENQMAQEGNMGQQIITNIKNGLGMIGDLANEFLIGFTALFWNSTQNQLTVFGIFSLVMLGIAITMAVVKLCMNLIRSNTGA